MQFLILDLPLFVLDLQFWGRGRGHRGESSSQGKGMCNHGTGMERKKLKLRHICRKKTVILRFVYINSCSNDAEGVNRILNFVLRKYFYCKSKLGTAGLFEKGIEK